MSVHSHVQASACCQPCMPAQVLAAANAHCSPVPPHALHQRVFLVLMLPAGKRVVVLESRLLGSGQTGRAVGDMSSWHTGLFSSLERWTSTEQRKQVSRHPAISPPAFWLLHTVCQGCLLYCSTFPQLAAFRHHLSHPCESDPASNLPVHIKC